MSINIEKLSLIALTGIFIVIIFLFVGRKDNNSNISAQSKISTVVPPAEQSNEVSPQPHLDMGRNYFDKNDYVSAISEYRKAIEAEPNFIDEKSNLFLGDEIKNAIKKTIYELTEKEKSNPDDKITKQGLKDAYYLKRRFGRGCE